MAWRRTEIEFEMELTLAKNCNFKLHRTALTLPAAAATGSWVAELCLASDTNVSTQLNRSEWAQVLWSPWLLYLTERVTSQRSVPAIQWVVRFWYWYADNGKQQTTKCLPACVFARVCGCVCVSVCMSCATPLLADSARRASNFCCAFVAVAYFALGLGPLAYIIHTATCCLRNLSKARGLSRQQLMFNALL